MGDSMERIIDDQGLVIDRPILESLGMPEGTLVSLRASPDGKGLIITPATEESASDREARILESARYVTNKHRAALKKLAE